MWVSATIAVLTSLLAANMLENGSFENSLEGWYTSHSWYEKPPGAGLSEAKIAEGEGRDGSRALVLIGGGKRGLAMAVKPAYPGRYRFSGWIKCEKIEAGQAGVLAEWITGEGKWISGDWAVQVKGTTDWQRFETELEAPPGTRRIHLDLLTTEPNDGSVWFDDISMERVPGAYAPPKAPEISVEASEGVDGGLKLSWNRDALGPTVVWLFVYCDPEPLREWQQKAPKAILDADKGEGFLWSLTNGRAYYVAARAVDGDGRASPMGPETQATPTDRQAPRPGLAEARAIGDDRCEVRWWPHPLDADVAKVEVCEEQDGQVRPLSSGSVFYEAERPFYCTEPWLKFRVAATPGRKIGVRCIDANGNSSEAQWLEILPAVRQDDLGERCDLWQVPATQNVPRDAQPPGAPGPIRLELMRGQAKGFQVVVRPREDLHAARVSLPEALVSEDGRAKIEAPWLAWHFVNYVALEANSIYTQGEERVWDAPAEFPDELSDDTWRDLPAGKAQPVYIRVTAPPEAAPGLYRGRGWLECAEGRKPFDVEVRVWPVELPEKFRLKFVYWFGWNEVCKQFGVEERSEDGWRALRQIARLMKAHHQNGVLVPWSLVKTWRRPDGTLTHDFSDFDRYVATFRSEGVDAIFCLSHFGARTTGEWECPTMSSHRHVVRRLDSGEEETIDALELLPALQEHIEELGLVERFAVHVADEPIPVNEASYRELSERVHRAAPKLRRIDAILVPDLRGALEIWCPLLNYFEQWLEVYRQAQQEGHEIWFYVAWGPQGRYPNRMIDGPAIKPRILHWLNAIYDTSGYVHWALNWWSIPLTSLNSPGDQYITWPSRRWIANSSLRYEAEREGLEDCELMFRLRDHFVAAGLTRDQAQHRVESIARRVVRSIQDYSRSWDELERTRVEMLRILSGE